MSAARIVILDDAQARAMEPFALTRPLGEVRAGALLVRERWEHVLAGSVTGRIGAAHLESFDEPGAPSSAAGVLPPGTVVVNARFSPQLAPRPTALAAGDALQCDGQVAAVALREPVPAAILADGTKGLDALAGPGRRDVAGWWMNDAWDLVRHLPAMLADDARVLAAAIPDEPPAHVAVLGEHRFAVARGAYIEPHVVVDTTDGDVVVLDGARISAFTRLAGPCVIGRHVHVNGGRFRTCAIGEHSRVCGEMSVVSLVGHSNKGHDGFIGHSAIGRWANFGAGTVTSNLKNSYGPVRVRDSRGDHDTGMQFLGSLVGDHAKLAIGTRLTTGTIVGAGANVFGDRSPDKFVPPFSWGDRAPFGRYEIDKFLQVAALVMQRRDVPLTDGMRRVLRAAWDR